MHPHAARDLARASRKVDGWFAAHGLFALLDEAQRNAQIHGDLFEIGVHHGKSAMMLGNMAADGERLVVCDIFGGQEANVSASGSGDRAVFEGNMARFAPNASLTVHESPSTELTVDAVGGGYRFFHVDGGHFAHEALADLELAGGAVIDRGVIVVDDPFQASWAGVTEAIFHFLDARPDWSTVAIGLNKLVLAKDDAEMYRRAVGADDAWRYIDRRVYARKTVPVAGADALVFDTPSYLRVPGLDATVARARWLEKRVISRLRR